MSTTTDLLDRYKKAKGIPSDNAAALQLGITRASVSGWRNEKNHAGPHLAEKMAEAIGEQPGPWIVRIEAERAHNPADRRSWLRLAQKIAIMTLIAGAPALLPHIAHAVTLSHVQGSRTLPIVSNLLRRLLRLARNLYGHGTSWSPTRICTT